MSTETIYENKQNKSAIRYNSFFEIYSIKTKNGVISIPKEVLDDLKEDSELVRELNGVLSASVLSTD